MKKFLLPVFFSALSFLSAQSWKDLSAEIGRSLDQAVSEYRAGEREKAKQHVSDAYFKVYEKEEMEQAVQFEFGARHNYETEDLFSELKRLVNKGAPAESLQAAAETLKKKLSEDAAVLDKVAPRNVVSPWRTFIQSFFIIFREGLEAILIVAAVVALLNKKGRKRELGLVYSGAGVGIFLSFVTALLINLLFHGLSDAGGAVREIMEGAVLLLAAGVLLSVSNWMIREVIGKDRIVGQLKEKTLVSEKTALWFVVFLSVFREGAETVLFYQAVIVQTPPAFYGLIGLGFLGGTVVLGVLFLLVVLYSVKIPLKPFFAISSVFLFLMAFSFSGRAFAELKEGGLFLNTGVSFPAFPVIGIYPLWPGLLLQAAVLLLGIVNAAGLIKKKNQNENNKKEVTNVT